MSRYCTRCGTQFLANQKFCRKCGSRVESADLPEATPQGFVTRVDAPAPTASPNPSRRTTDPIPGSVETVALHPEATAQAGSPVGSTIALGDSTAAPTPLRPAPQREVRSLPITASLRAGPIIKVINIAAGLLVLLVGIGLVVWYLGIGRPTGYSIPQTPPAPEASSTNPTPAPPVQPASEAPAETPALAEATTEPANGKPRVNSNTAPTAPVSEPRAQSPAAETQPMPAPVSAPAPEATKPPRSAAPELGADDHVRRGRDLLNSGSYDRAISEFRNASRLQPANDDVHYLAGVAYDKLGQRAEALQEFARCKSGTYAPLASQHVKRLSKQLKNKQ